MRAGITVLTLTTSLAFFPFQVVMAADTTAPNIAVEANSIPNKYLDTEAPDGVGAGSGSAESVAGVTSSDDSTKTTDNSGVSDAADSEMEKAKAAAEAAKNNAEKAFEKAMTDKPDNGANNAAAAADMSNGEADSSVDQDLEMFKKDAEKGAEQAVTDSSDTGVDDTATADDDY